MVNFNIRLNDDLHKRIKDSAKRSKRSMNNEILEAIEFYLTHCPSAQYAAIEEVVKGKANNKKKK